VKFGQPTQVILDKQLSYLLSVTYRDCIRMNAKPNRVLWKADCLILIQEVGPECGLNGGSLC